MTTRHIDYVESLPDDCIQIKQYNGQKYSFLYYSPNTKSFYQAPALRFRKLNEVDGVVRPKSDSGVSTRISLRVFEKRRGDEIPDREETSDHS